MDSTSYELCVMITRRKVLHSETVVLSTSSVYIVCDIYYTFNWMEIKITWQSMSELEKCWAAADWNAVISLV